MEGFMNKKIVIGVCVVVVLAVGGVLVLAGRQPRATTGNTNTSGSANDSSANTSGTLSSTSMAPSFTIHANDDSADHEAISVKKGAQVSLTFSVDSAGVYHGGLQFKSDSPAIDSGAIAPGDSKTVTFTAGSSFSFQPYWYASGVKKNYLITVNVEQ